MKKYRNKETGEVVSGDIRISEKRNWNLHNIEFYISTFRKILYTSLENFEKEWEFIKNYEEITNE